MQFGESEALESFAFFTTFEVLCGEWTVGAAVSRPILPLSEGCCLGNKDPGLTCSPRRSAGPNRCFSGVSYLPSRSSKVICSNEELELPIASHFTANEE